MSSHTFRQPTLSERVSSLPSFLRAVCIAGLQCLWQKVLSARRRHWALRRIFGAVLLRSRIWARDQLPTTGTTIKDACVKRKLTCREHLLPGVKGDWPDARLHEIRLSDGMGDSPVMLYFHGGGYRNPISIAHTPLAVETGTALCAETVFLLEYTLTPEARYPTQLKQAIRALNYLLNSHGIEPSRIVFGGDSAGGHLVLSLLAHILRPKEGLETVVHSQRFKGAFLLSPWATTLANAPSFEQNDSWDFITTQVALDFADKFKPDRDEIWAEPLLAGRDFWRALPVDNILVTGGTEEILRDPIVKIFESLSASEENGTRCELAMIDGEIHVHMALDYALHLPSCESRKRLLAWAKDLAGKTA